MFNSNKPKNVETITAKLHDTVNELVRHADEQLLHAEAQRERADAAKAAHYAHLSEHSRAVAVANNIKSLLGVA